MEVPGRCGYTWSVVKRLVGCTAKFSEMTLETACSSEMNIKFTGNSSGGHPAISMPTACSSKTYSICGIVFCDRTAHGWNILLKERCSDHGIIRRKHNT